MTQKKANTVQSMGFMTVLLGLIVCETACNGAAHSRGGSALEFQRLSVAGNERRNGIFDPSLEYADDEIGWMAYSSIEIPKFVETHIARSSDHGGTWAFIAKANTSDGIRLEANHASVDGVLRHETPSLLFDPADKPDRRWKLFTNRYVIVKPFGPTDRRMSQGTIDVQYSASPDRGWSKPVCAIGPLKDCRADIANMDPSLADVKFMTEPGAIVENGVIYMSMDVGASEHGLGNWEHYRIILLASEDHGESWRYAGTLLDHNDAIRFNYLVFTGSSLVRKKGRLYLFATPSGATNKKRRDHDGTMVMELTDISQAKVARDKKGVPVVVKYIAVEKQSGGLADYDEQNTTGGIVLAQLNFLGMPEVFQIWNTGATLADHPKGE